MTRFMDAVELWRGMTKDECFESVASRTIGPGKSGAAWTLLADVVKAVDSYERTIRDLKRQNAKLRGRRAR